MIQTNGRGAGTRGAVPDYYRWAVAGKPVAVHLDFDVVDRLLQEVMRGFGLMPRRSVEVGGLLLGSVEEATSGDGNWVVSITDFEPVPCRHSHGAGWALSDEEQVRFEEVLAKWHPSDGKRTFAVGFFRSHTREGMGLTGEDLEMYKRYFPDPWPLVLLVKPFATRASVGAFFLRENGHVRGESSYLEFPFRRRDLGGALPEEEPEGDKGDPGEQGKRESGTHGTETYEPRMQETMSRDPWRAGGEAAAGGDPMTAQQETSDQLRWGLPVATAEPRGPGGSSRMRSGWVWIPLSFIFLLLGVVLGWMVSMSLQSQTPKAVQGDAFTMRLSVARSSGETVHVRWDRNAPAIQASSRGLLHIADGGNEKVVDLDVLQLQNGSVVYRRATNAVRFRLEVFAGERLSISESAEYRE